MVVLGRDGVALASEQQIMESITRPSGVSRQCLMGHSKICYAIRTVAAILSLRPKTQSSRTPSLLVCIAHFEADRKQLEKRKSWRMTRIFLVKQTLKRSKQHRAD